MGLAKQERADAAAGRGCLGEAADDEPVFILRAQDLSADALVDLWAENAESNGCDPAKVAEARELAKKMRAWPSRKSPD